MSNDDTKHEGSNKVAVKLPTFYTDRPEVWFAMVESQFHTAQVTRQLTKFHYVLQGLDKETRNKLPNSAFIPRETDPYDAIKAIVLALYKPTDHARIAQLHELLNSGPTLSPDEAYTKATTTLAGVDDLQKAFTHYIILNTLPAQSKAAALAATHGDTKTLLDLARDAVKLSEAESPVSAVGRKKSAGTASRPRKACMYHQRFGKKAKKCETPDFCPPLVPPEAPTYNNPKN